MIYNFAEMEQQLKNGQVWQLKLDCGHTIETAGFGTREIKTGQIFCPLESLIQSRTIVSKRKIALKFIVKEESGEKQA